MGVYQAIITADSFAKAAALRDLKLDLHERAARRLSNGDLAVPAILHDEQIAQLRDNGYGVEIEHDAEQIAGARIAEVDPQVNRFAQGAPKTDDQRRVGRDDGNGQRNLERLMDLSDLGERDARSDHRTVLGGYLSAEEVESALRTLADTYPDLATVSALPEKSLEGRTSHMVRLSGGVRQRRAGVLVTGGVHAREWGGSDICLAFATNLLKSYATAAPLRYGSKTFDAAEVAMMLENLEIFVFPDVNPDGKAYSQSVDPAGGAQSFWWRKNRRTGLAGGAEGVDINRNFDFLWSSGIGTATDPAQFTYKGTEAFSEPESRNVRFLLETYGHITYYVDVHSFGDLILYSWGDDENQDVAPAQQFLNAAFDNVRGVVGDSAYREFMTGEDQAKLVALAEDMNKAIAEVRGKRYTVQQAVGLYPTSATSDDYAFSRHLVDEARQKVYAFTIEFGQQFVPPYSEMRHIMADVAAALTELCGRAAAG
jgi:carboxypeptidase T